MGDEKAPQQEALDPNDPRLASDGGDVKKGLDQEDPDHGPFDEADQLVFLETRGGGTRDAYLATAASYVGIKEDPDDSNLTILGQKFGWSGVPWCAEAASVCQQESHVRGFHTAGVWDAVTRAKRGENGMQFLGPDAALETGLLPCFDWKHNLNPNNMHIGTGIYRIVDERTWWGYEGNYSNKFTTVKRQRDADLMGFIKLAFAPVATALRDDAPTVGDVFDPNIRITADCAWVGPAWKDASVPGFRQLGNDGGVFNWLGAPDHGSPVGKHYFEGRTPLFIAYDHDVNNNPVPIGMYVVVAKSPTGVIERFGPQF
jgi:hypothetical protein